MFLWIKEDFTKKDLKYEEFPEKNLEQNFIIFPINEEGYKSFFLQRNIGRNGRTFTHINEPLRRTN